MSKRIKVATVQEVPPGTSKQVEIEGKSIALFNVGGTFYAIGNECTHAGASLAEGTAEGEEVECPWHGARFNLKTGAVLCPPAAVGVPAFKVAVSGSDIEIEL